MGGPEIFFRKKRGGAPTLSNVNGEGPRSIILKGISLHKKVINDIETYFSTHY